MSPLDLLTEETRRAMLPLCVFRRAARLEVMAVVLEIEPSEALEMGRRLVELGLAKAVGHYLFPHPALREALALEMDPAAREAAERRWRAGMEGLALALDHQHPNDARGAAEGTILALVDLVEALESNVQAVEAGAASAAAAMEFATSVERLVSRIDHPEALGRVRAARESVGALAEADRLYGEIPGLCRDGKLDAAIPLAERALTLRETALGPVHPRVAIALEALAVLCGRKSDYARAEPLFQRAVSIWEEAMGLEHRHLADSLDHLADLYYLKGDYAKAEPCYRRAAAIKQRVLGPEHPDVARSLNGLAMLCHKRGDHAQAESLYQRALSLRENALGPEHRDVALSLNDLAALYHTMWDCAKAELLYQRALRILEKTGPGPIMAQSLSNLAEVYRTRGDFAKAEPPCVRALSIREATLGPAHPDVAQSLNNLALLHQGKGDYARAEPLFQRALSIWERALGPEHPEVAVSLNNLAVLHRLKGDYAAAAPLYLRALAIREKTLGPAHPDVAQSLNNVAALHGLEGDHEREELLHRKALDIRMASLGPEHPDVANSLNNLAQLYTRTARYADAEPLCRRALAIQEKALGPEHFAVATSLNNLAVLCDRMGDRATAESLCLRALSIQEKALGPEHPDVVVSLGNLGGLYLARGDAPEALRSMQRAVAIQDRNAAVLLTTGSDEQKRAYMATLRDITDYAISLHVQSMPDAREAARLALTTILNRKGRVLDALADSYAALRRRLDPEDQGRLDQLRSAAAEYSALVWRGPGDTPQHDYRSALARLDEERRKLEADISRRGVELHGDLRPVTPAQVQAAIPEGAALVELFRYTPYDPRTNRWSEPRYVAYVLRHGGDVAWVDLGEAEVIEAAVDRLLRALAHPAADPPGIDPRAGARDLDAPAEPVADHRPAARELDRLVLDPIRRLLGSTRRILMSPDFALNLVPFAALVDEEGRYLVERCALTYLASGRDLLRLTTRVPPRRGPVVVAAPDYEAVLPSSVPSHGGSRSEPAAGIGAIRFEPLRFAAEEGRAIARKLPGSELLTGADATESAVKRLAAPSLLHIATHGFFLPGRPESSLLRSGIALAGANRRHGHQDDGVLTALEVSQLDLTGTRLVVLSACLTGVGEVTSGDGVYGLRRALVMAGAETQVMSLWGVDDAATCDLMEAYYEKLLAEEGRGEALRRAQLEMLIRRPRAHPYYWASFIVSGNDAPLTEW